MTPSVLIRFNVPEPFWLVQVGDDVATVRSRLPIVTSEFLFGGQPIIYVVAIPPLARLVEVVSEPSDLVP